MNHSDEGRFVGNVCAPCYANKPMLGWPSRRELFALSMMHAVRRNHPDESGSQLALWAAADADALLRHLSETERSS
jgi:hypothetical protein